MTIALIQAIATLCLNDFPGAQEKCQKTYIECVQRRSVETMRKNMRPDDTVILTLCMLERFNKESLEK